MSLCNAPFTNLYYSSNTKQVAFCCDMERQPIKTSINDWWNSDYSKQIRQMMLDRKYPVACKSCARADSLGLEPHSRSFDSQTIPKDITKPTSIDYRPDNLCNLQCTMCSPVSSNLVEQLWSKYPDVFGGVTPVPKDEGMDQQLMNTLDKQTVALKVLGGEPTINKRVHEVFKYCIDNGYAENIDLRMTTNFTNMNRTYELLEQFKTVKIGASLDATGPTYEYIRQPAKWNSVKNHILDFSKRYTGNKKFKLSVNMVWQPTSAFTVKTWLPELFDLFYNQVTVRTTQIDILPVSPHHTNWASVPTHLRSSIIQDLDSVTCTNSEQLQIVRDMKQIASSYEPYSLSEQQKFKQWTLQMDKHKKTNILELDPRFKELLEC